MVLCTKCTWFIKCFLLFICIESCHAGNSQQGAITDTGYVKEKLSKDTFAAGKLMPIIVCKADAGKSYALYIPANKNKTDLPVIYFFDPHADGAGTLNRYTNLAERYGFILVASNNSKNGNDWSTEENIWNILSTDSRQRLNIDTARMYVCGFSGGAKAATYIALLHPGISAVIACGAVLPEMLRDGNLNFTFTAITGEGDLNRSDLVATDNSLNNTDTKHRIIYFDGIHEWPPAPVMDIAFAGLQFDAMAKKLIAPDSLFINKYISESQKRINGFLQKNNQLRAEAECIVSIKLLTGLTDAANWFAEKDKAIKSSKAYEEQLAIAAKLQEREQEIKALYQQRFQQADMSYWVKEINDVMVKSKLPGTEAAMYQRLKAYLSLAFYSISNQHINSSQDAAAQHFVSLYKLVDDSNSEAWYFSAILNARAKNAEQAKADLLKAISKGFNNKTRLMQQPEFQQSGLLINVNEIISAIK